MKTHDIFKGILAVILLTPGVLVFHDNVWMQFFGAAYLISLWLISRRGKKTEFLP